MRTPLLAQICPLLAALVSSTAQAGTPLVLPDTKVAPAASTPVARARQVLTARAPSSAALTLDHVSTAARPGGQQLVRFAQSHAGIPVLSRGASALLDAKGNPTSFATARLEERFPASASPSLSAALAAKRAERLARGARFGAGDAKLAWLPRAGGARLVWVLYQGLVPGTPFSPVVVVDAQSGGVLLAYDATRFDRAATVYEQNPVSTPTATSVTLSTLAQGATKLEDTRIRSLTCVDTQKLVGKWNIHMCEFLHKAVADANGDFPYSYTSDTAAEDEFAEVSMYFHTARAYAFYETLGMPELDFKPLNTVANLRFPQGWESGNPSKMGDPTLPLEPYDNAFFSPQSPYPGLFQGLDGGLFFGQGTNADFAYDGDVVYHELGHALTDRTINFASHWLMDEQGSSPAPGAMNEALADYFSSALTGDGQVGEYAAKNTSYGYGDKVIRDLDNDDTCPKNIAGEVHVDSTLFSGALWKVRQSLAEPDRNTFDEALVTAMLGAPTGELGYEGLGELFRAAVEASTLGKTAADALVAELEARGVLPVCKRVLEYKGQPLSSGEWKFANGFFAPGKPYMGLDQSESYAPGLLQVHTTLKAGTDQIKVQWENVPLGPQYDFGPDADPYTPAVLVRFATDPIVFDYSQGVASNADLFDADTSAGRYATIDVPKDATDAWVMIVNKGDEPGLFYSVEVVQKTTSTGGTGGFGGSGGFGGVATGGTGGNPVGSGGGYDFDQDLNPVGGCACVAAPSGQVGALGGLALTGLALALLRRRRSGAR